MFWFWKKKKEINSEKIKWFNRALKAIKTFIFIEDWKKTYAAIEEVKIKEKEAYEALMIKISDSDKIDLQEKEKHTSIFNKKIKELDKLKEIAQQKEEIIKRKIDDKRFKIRFERIKREVNSLSKTWNNTDALNLLSNFLEENKDNSSVINFYNKEKKSILKSIDKQRKKEELKIKNNAKLEAMKLMWETIKTEEEKKEKKNEEAEEKVWFFKRIKNKINIYNSIKSKLRNKKMLDDILLLIDEDNRANNDIASKKLANMHKWLIKEISNEKMLWYDFFWKILWADKISWDAFWFSDIKEKYNFFLWDATGHWIRAWFIITLLSKLFNDFVKDPSLQKICMEINNWLKQNLQNRNFITWVFFQIDKVDIWKILYVWMGHEPMLIYRAKEQKVERLLPGWLAAWIRVVKNIDDIKVKEIDLQDGDVLVVYSDWITETKNIWWEFYWIEGLEKQVEKVFKIEDKIQKAYEDIINDIKIFKWWASFEDDSTLLIIKRNSNKDIQNEDNTFIKELSIKEWLNRSEKKKLAWKTKDEISVELQKIRKEKELKNIIKNLDTLYYTWEILKLKQEAIRFIKEWHIHKRINYYLKKAIANEQRYKIDKKNQKIASKYNVLKELYAKWDFDTVIKECENVIAKDWNI